MNKSYLFTSSNLGFRTWQDSGLDAFSEMNSDLEMMRYFEKPLSTDESKAMMERMNLYKAMDKINGKLGEKTICRAVGMSMGRRRFNPFNGIAV